MSPVRKLALLLALAIILGGAWLAPLDSSAATQAENGLKRALASFATARALNAVISVAQGTEVSIQLAGFGPNFTPGQVLDPINDLVEQFSTLMLFASASFGVQLFLIKIGGHAAVSLLLSLATLAWAWALWTRSAAQAVLTRLFLGLLLVRFAMALVVVGSGAGFQWFLAESYQADQARIEASTSRITSLSGPAVEAKPGEGLVDRFKRAMEELKQAADETARHVVMLIAVFLLQTLVLPLLILWLLLRLGGILGELALPRRQSGSTIA